MDKEESKSQETVGSESASVEPTLSELLAKLSTGNPEETQDLFSKLQAAVTEKERLAEEERKARQEAERLAEEERKGREEERRGREEERKGREEERKGREEERKGREEERKGREEERRAKHEAERLAEGERRARQEAERLAEEERKGRPIAVIIRDSPLFGRQFEPSWDDGLLSSESKNGTKTSRNWLEIDPDHVREWPDTEIVALLKTADDMTTTDGRPLLDVILKEGTVQASQESYYNGKEAATYASKNGRVHVEKDVESCLLVHLWRPLCGALGLRGELEGRYPAASHLICRIKDGGLVKEKDEDIPQTFAPMPPQFKGLYKRDKALELCMVDAPTKDFPTFLDETDNPRAYSDYSKHFSRILIEVKPDVLCPKKKDRDNDVKNEILSGSLWTYLKSRAFFDPKYNPVAQAVTYAVVSRTRCFMIHTLNRMAIGLVDVDDTGELDVRVSKWFHSTWKPDDIFPESHIKWPMFEVLVRLLLACRKEWYVARFPNLLKQLFLEKVPKGGENNEETEKKKGDRDGDNDEHDGDSGNGGDDSGGGRDATGGMDSNTKKGSGDGKGSGRRGNRSKRGGSKGGSRGRGSTSSQKRSQDALLKGLSAGEKMRLPLQVALTTKRKTAHKRQSQSRFLLSDFCYADLWAPLRFAVPSTHSIEEESTWKHLEGDAELLSDWCRTGLVYRKKLHGFDCVFKLLPWSAMSDESEEDPCTLQEELRNEYAIYKHLESLQGDVIPRVLWYGELVSGMMDALVTEFAGETLESKTLVDNSDPQVKNELWHNIATLALKALQRVHASGVTHGDVALRNFVYCKHTKRVKVIDFAFAEIQQDPKVLKREISKELTSLRELLTSFLHTRAPEVRF